LKWSKHGLIYVADGQSDWAQSHAYVPVPLILDNVVRIFVAFLDKDKIGRIGCVDLDKNDLTKVVDVSAKPLLDVGKSGTFDEHGVTPLSIFDINGTPHLYYAGWQRGDEVRYTLFLGLAKYEHSQGGSFARLSSEPVLTANEQEKCVRSSAFALIDNGLYKMWYAGGSDWIKARDKLVPTYTLRYLESQDGINWKDSSQVCMEPANDDEIGFSRPFIIKEYGLFKMWYSVRTLSKGYRLGYAESANGLHWDRKDNEVGIDVSPDGWDSEMICFGSIIDINNQRYMIYNGNNYGQTGFGLAVLEN